jgi:FSR family fosmidomycin resistance protein-like MFS transporter
MLARAMATAHPAPYEIPLGQTTTSTPASPRKGIDKPALASIILAHAAVDMQTISLVTLLPSLLAAFNLNYATAAVIVTMNQTVIAVAQPIFGIIGDRKPVRWLALFGCALCGLMMASITFLPSYALVMAAVVLSGIGSAIFHPEGLAHARTVSGDQLNTGNSWFFLGGNIGFGVGPLLVGALMLYFGANGPALMIVPTLLGCILLWLQMSKFHRSVEAPSASSTQTAPTELVANRNGNRHAVIALIGFLLLLIILRSVAYEGLKTFIPLYFSHETGKTAAEFAPLLTAISLAGIVGTLFSGPLADRIGRRAVMVGSMAVAIAALFAFWQATSAGGVWQIICIGIFGMAITAPWTITVTAVQDLMPRNIGLASGLTLGTAYGASGIGVGLLGVLANATSLAFTLQFIAVIPAIVLVLSWFVPEQKRALKTATA